MHTAVMADGWNERLRRRIRELGLTDSAVARALDIPQRRFANYTQGVREPDFGMLLRICRFLRTSPDTVLGASEPVLPANQDMISARLEAAVLAMTKADQRRALAIVEAFAASAQDEDADHALRGRSGDRPCLPERPTRLPGD